MAEADRKIAALHRRMNQLENESDQRHRDNLRRFESLEKAAAKVEGELKIVILLLVAQLGTNIAHLFGG